MQQLTGRCSLNWRERQKGSMVCYGREREREREIHEESVYGLQRGVVGRISWCSNDYDML